MGKLSVFNFITLNGYYKGVNEDISWHRHEAEEADYAAESANTGDRTLIFGRVTYEMMQGFWTTPMAMEVNPGVATGMNQAEKIVFSRTLDSVDWHNAHLIKEDLIGEISRLKAIPDKHMTILGSGSIVSQLAEVGLIDAYQLMLDPVALGDGATLFKGISRKLDLKLINSRVFKSGVVMLDYEPVKTQV